MPRILGFDGERVKDTEQLTQRVTHGQTLAHTELRMDTPSHTQSYIWTNPRTHKVTYGHRLTAVADLGLCG